MILLIGFLFFILVYAGIVSLVVGFFPAVAFINHVTFILHLVTLSFFLIVTKSGKILGKYIKSSFKKEYEYTVNELESLVIAIKNIIKFIIPIGILGVMIFIVCALYWLDDVQHLGPHLAMSFTSIIYAIAIGFFIFFPVQTWAENKINAMKNDKSC